MKKLSTFLFLIFFSFQTSSWAEDITDFQIEGMSIGDSLLDYMSENEILNLERYDNTNTEYTSDKFFDLRTKKMGPYEEILIGLKYKDNSYKIYVLAGVIKYENNISDCYNEMKSIEKEFKNLFPNAEILRVDKEPHDADKSGISTVTSIYFDFISEDYASIQCFDWKKDIGYYDNLRIGIFSNTYSNWLMNEAYN